METKAQFQAAMADKNTTDHSTLLAGLKITSESHVESSQVPGSSKNIASWPSFLQSSKYAGTLAASGLIPSASITGSVPILGGTQSAKDSYLCLISNVAGKIHSHADVDQQDRQAAGGTNSAASKKRKQPTTNIEEEGCPNCSCRKSTCLRLYCECFAAGVYCIDSCECKNCYNNPDYEDTVDIVREELGILPNPADTSHLGGCNCKNSTCLDQQCACFMGYVGCSDRCGCDCFGRRTESEQQEVNRGENPSHVEVQSETGSNSTQTDWARTESDLKSDDSEY